MSETLYIVMAETGSYSDWSQWAVAAYRDEATARQHAEGAEAARRLRITLRGSDAAAVFDGWDAQGDIADAYSLMEVELREQPPDIAPLERMQAGRRRQGQA